MGDGLEIGVEHRALRIQSLSMAVSGCSGVKTLSELILSTRGKLLLVLEQNDVMLIEGISDNIEIRI